MYCRSLTLEKLCISVYHILRGIDASPVSERPVSEVKRVMGCQMSVVVSGKESKVQL